MKLNGIRLSSRFLSHAISVQGFIIGGAEDWTANPAINSVRLNPTYIAPIHRNSRLKVLFTECEVLYWDNAVLRGL